MINDLNALEVVTLFVEDLAGARAFYQGVFGRPTVFEDAVSTAYRFENLVINLLQRDQADELVEPRPVGDTTSGLRMLLTIKVENVDAVCEALTSHGAPLLNGPIDRPWGRRTATFADPAGNVWEVAQEI